MARTGENFTKDWMAVMRPRYITGRSYGAEGTLIFMDIFCQNSNTLTVINFKNSELIEK